MWIQGRRSAPEERAAQHARRAKHICVYSRFCFSPRENASCRLLITSHAMRNCSGGIRSSRSTRAAASFFSRSPERRKSLDTPRTVQIFFRASTEMPARPHSIVEMVLSQDRSFRRNIPVLFCFFCAANRPVWPSQHRLTTAVYVIAALTYTECEFI